MEFAMHNNNLYLTILYVLTFVVHITYTQDVYGESWNSKYNRCPRLYPKKFVGYAPRGNLTAGNYTEKTELKGIKQCVTGCCESDLCNVVFMHDITCYHIECVTNELCLPLLRNESPSLGLHVSMVLVNPVLADESWAEVLEQANFRSELASTLQEEIYNNLANHRPELAENTLGYMKYDNPSANSLLSHFVDSGSIDPESLSNDDFHYLEAKGDQVMEGSSFIPKKLYPCEVGVIIDCPSNEECASVGAKSRNGFCQCKDGFRRSPAGLCVSDSMLETVPYAAVISTSKKDVEQAESMARAGIAESKGMNLKAVETSTENNVKKLTVSAISKEVRLPENEVSLSAYTIPDEKMTNDHYSYAWTLVDQPKGGFTGNMKQNGGTVKLSQLTEGSYSFKVAVNGSNSYGEGFANVTVLPVKRINQPPVVVITPTSQTVKLPNTGAVLDGSASKDDDAIISWHWELTSGPLGYQPPLHDGPTLQLSDLRQPGNYSFRLTVEDSDHIKNSTTANITVLNHTDYPPEANAGQDVIIYMPKNNLTLNGSLSSDDHAIATWEWTKSAEDQNKAVDMQNTHSPYLQLSNLSEGAYTFTLKVTDSSGQSSTADVHVFVQPPTNTPPKAVAGPDQFIPLPQTWAILNASGSSDDHRIVAYTWHFGKGPANATIQHFNESVANATQLTKGEYTFQLTVLDDNGNSASDSMMVTVTQNKNAPPKADAGGDQVVSLPVSVIVLNGSRSSDDFRIVSWNWARDPSGLAVGTVVADSDKQAVLMLTDVVPGRYVFSLSVTDDQGASNTDTVSIQVKADPNERSLLEMTLDAPVQSFTQGQLDGLRQKLTLLLRQGLEMNVTHVRAELDTGRTQIVFFLFDKATSSPVVGLEALSAVRGALRGGGDALVRGVRGVRTARCQDACSGRGVCDQATRACLCDAFWMQNLFTPLTLDAEPNCDWSVVYASLGALCLAASLGCACWAASRGARRLCMRVPPAPPRRPARLARYQLLGASDHEDKPFASNKISESDTDSDVLFESRSKTSSLTSRILNGDLPPVPNHTTKNGHRNGYMKSGRRIKT